MLEIGHHLTILFGFTLANATLILDDVIADR